MCQMSMKLPDIFYQNPPHTLDQMVAKHIQMKNDLALTLSINVKSHSKNSKISTWGTKNMPKTKEQGFS